MTREVPLPYSFMGDEDDDGDDDDEIQGMREAPRRRGLDLQKGKAR